LPVPAAGSDARSARWMPVDEVRGTLAFDHDQILDDAAEAARSRLELTTLATVFCEVRFAIGDLRHVYEVVWGVPLDPRNFSRKVAHTEGFVVAAGEQTDTGDWPTGSALPARAGPAAQSAAAARGSGPEPGAG
jgi:8-oxo-dGTP diphosphatase